MQPAIASMIVISRTNTDRWGAIGCRGSVIAAPDEEVAGATHGADPDRLARIVAQLLADAADQDVDRAVERLPVHAPGLVHDPVARQDPPAGAYEQPEQIELGGRQRQERAVEPRRARGPVDLEPAGGHPLVAGMRSAAPQH